MFVQKDSQAFKDFWYGNTPINAIYSGSSLVWQRGRKEASYYRNAGSTEVIYAPSWAHTVEIFCRGGGGGGGSGDGGNGNWGNGGQAGGAYAATRTYLKVGHREEVQVEVGKGGAGGQSGNSGGEGGRSRVTLYKHTFNQDTFANLIASEKWADADSYFRENAETIAAEGGLPGAGGAKGSQTGQSAGNYTGFSGVTLVGGAGGGPNNPGGLYGGGGGGGNGGIFGNYKNGQPGGQGEVWLRFIG